MQTRRGEHKRQRDEPDTTQYEDQVDEAATPSAPRGEHLRHGEQDDRRTRDEVRRHVSRGELTVRHGGPDEKPETDERYQTPTESWTSPSLVSRGPGESASVHASKIGPSRGFRLNVAAATDANRSE